MSNRKSLCLSCEHLTAKPPFDVLRCDLGRRILTLSDPRLCREHVPVQHRRIKTKGVEDPDQLALFGMSLT